MRKGGRVFILLGVTLALAAAVLAIFAFSDAGETEEVAEAEEPMVEVIEAAQDIPVNHVITEDDITVVEVEERTVSPGTARSTGQVLGLASSGDIVSGQRVLMANLVTPGLSHIVDDGMRAVAIPIDRVNALGGMIRAEDRIDIIYSIALDIEDFAESLREALAEEGMQLQQQQQAQEGQEGEEGEEGEAQPDIVLPDFSDIPFPGDPGSLFTIMTSEGHQPITKLMLQDIRVVRVVAGDVTVDDEGRMVQVEEPATTADDADDEDQEQDTETTNEAVDPDRLPETDMLILEVDPESAELIKFILDYEGQFQIALRGPEDSAEVDTPGMTFRQMIEDLGLPVPRPAEIPEEGDEEE
jgi:pilus assembly protein CpaB